MTNEHNCGERTNSDGYYVVKHRIPYDDSSQLERSYRTALPLHTGMYDVSLLKLTPQIFQKTFITLARRFHTSHREISGC
jgi:hypothetical protein